MLLYKIVINITNKVSYHGLGSVGFTIIALTNLLFNVVMVSNFVTFLPYYNLKILKLYGFVHWGLLYNNTIFFIQSFISNVSKYNFPTAAAIFLVYPLVGRFGVELIKHKTNRLISWDLTKEKNPLRMIKIAQLMIRFITKDKSRMFTLASEPDLDDLIMAGLLVNHKTECRNPQCFCKQKALLDQITAYETENNSKQWMYH